MTQLLIIGDTIFAQGPFNETTEEIFNYDIRFPKAVIPGWQIVECDVSDGFVPNAYTWNGTAPVLKPPLSPSPMAQRAAIQAQIDTLERESLENRGSRELHLREMEREAAAQAAAISTPDVPVTADQVLATVPYYVKLNALDSEVKVLRDAYNAVV